MIECECGCGLPVRIVRGVPNRFAGAGHWSRISAEPIENKYVVNATTGCWEWQRAITNGYGVVQDLRAHRQTQAHRAVYELHHGPIPEGMTLDHLCRNRACVNPNHLEPVSRGENVLRGEGHAAVNARKTHCKRGHEFTPENSYYAPNGKGKRCRECFKTLRRKGGPYHYARPQAE